MRIDAMMIARGGFKLKFCIAATLGVFVSASSTQAEQCDQGKRLFEHAGGITCIPNEPERIVTLSDQNALLPLLELGVRPVGSAGMRFSDGREGFRRIQAHDTAGIAFIGDYRTPDIELAAALQPDLIVTNAGLPKIAERFASVAPVVQIDTAVQPLERALFQFANLVNRTDRALELERAFEQRVAEIETSFGDLRESTTVSLIAYGGGDVFGAIGPSQAYGMILRSLNPTRPEAERDLQEISQARSIETVLAHNADVMIQVVFDTEWAEPHQYETLIALPLVQFLPVAQAGQIFAIDGTQMVGSAWEKAMNGLELMADILTDPNIDRDLVLE